MQNEVKERVVNRSCAVEVHKTQFPELFEN
jgi:hypothetical protein